MKLIVPVLIVSGFLASEAQAVSSSGAYGSASVSVIAYDVDTYEPVPLLVTGRSSVLASAGISSPGGRSGQTDTASVTFTNPTGSALELYVEFNLVSQSNTDIPDGVVTPDTRYDSNAFVQLGALSVFTSTNGTYRCDDPDFGSPGFNCFGVFADDLQEIFDTPLDYLNPFGSLTFSLEATAFAFIEAAPSAVPLPAGTLLLLSGLGLFGLGRLRR